jgi:hypothetical protein
VTDEYTSLKHTGGLQAIDSGKGRQNIQNETQNIKSSDMYKERERDRRG